MKSPRLLASKAARPFLFAAGCVLAVVGVAGLVLPLLPGTVFLILAAACFARSSPRFEHWLITHPTLGPPIVAWRETGSIPRRAKVIAIAGMVVSFVMTFLSGAPPLAVLITGLVLMGAAIYVATRPVTPR